MRIWGLDVERHEPEGVEVVGFDIGGAEELIVEVDASMGALSIAGHLELEHDPALDAFSGQVE